jgi:hypothetical protein
MSRSSGMGALALVLASLAAAACGTTISTPSPTLPAQQPTEVAPSLPEASLSAHDLAEAIRFRGDFGFRTDEAWIRAVAADPASAEGQAMFGVPLTPEEFAEIVRRSQTSDVIKAVVIPYGLANPDDWAGAWIDHQHAGRFVVQFSGQIEKHRAALYAKISPDANFEVRAVQFSTAELRELDATLMDPANEAWFGTIPARLLGYGPNEPTNRYHVEISSANPNAAALIEQHFGWQGVVEVESDGTGALLLPVGTLRVRATNQQGLPVPGLTCVPVPDMPGSYEPPIGGTATNREGVCELELPATGYWIRLERDGVFVALGRAVVRPEGNPVLEIRLEAPPH